MGLKDIPFEIRYRSDRHDIPTDFFIPVLKECKLYKRSVGFFSTSSLLSISTGLFEFARKGGKVQLICSPTLSKEDIEAINTGYKSRKEVFEKNLQMDLREPLNYYEEERLNLIANMIAKGMLDIKIAFMENGNGINMYHEKMAVFEDNFGNKLGFAGSLNESQNSFVDNFESIYIFCDWKEENERRAVQQLEEDFDNMWNNNTNKLRVISFPEIVIEKLMKFRKKDIDFEIDNKEYKVDEFSKKKQGFHVPENVELRDYQKEAIEGWKNQDYKGIFSMSTGSGKSYTALACAIHLAERLEDKLAVFIVCPYIHLVGQWEEDVVDWMSSPVIIAHSKSTTPDWENKLVKAYKKFRNNGKPFVCITTNDTFASEKIQDIISRFTIDNDVLLIVDEAHNFGSNRLSMVLPENIKYRIALSATIKRHMDKKGTKKLFDYFGEECIVYTLERAIKEGALCRYKYYPIFTYLESDEVYEYSEITNKLRKFIVEENGKTKISEEGKLLLFKRSRLLAGAKSKPEVLKNLLRKYQYDDSILVYCGATSMEDDNTGEIIRQIDLVTKMINDELGMRAHKFTAEEDLRERQYIKKYFQDGIYKVITAIKCLDEGVNIPGIKTAFIMSSSKNPKEFVQRRGRLLRKSPNKEIAEIFDFITLPHKLTEVTYQDFEKDKSIIIGEMYRMNEFAKLAENQLDINSAIDNIMYAYEVSIDVEAEIEKMEEYYE